MTNNQQVAVKHIINDDGNMETFVREVTSLSHVRHPNLVALLGFCIEGDECFLVYELCPNGSLSEWLFGNYNLSLFFCGIMRVWNFVCSSIYLWSFEDLTSEYINQARTRCCPGYRGWKLQLIVLEVFGFCTHIQEDALFTVTSRSIFINIPDTLICTFAL